MACLLSTDNPAVHRSGMLGFYLRGWVGGGGGGGGNRAPQNWRGGFGKRAQLTDTIITNEKELRIHFF